MRTEELTCNSCGAPLEVPEGASYVRCNHCRQQLAIRRSDSVTFTETVEDLVETTEALSDQIEELTRQNKLADLDRRWERDRERFMVKDSEGRLRMPNSGGAVVGGFVAVAFGVVWTAMAIGITSGAPAEGPFGVARIVFPAFGILFIVGGFIAAMNQHQKAGEYRAAEQRYRAERREIEQGAS